MPDALKNKILTQIHQQKPYSWWRFFLINVIKIIAVFILFCLSSLVLSYFVWDLIEANTLLAQSDQNLFTILNNSLPELLLFVLFVSLVLYLLYRQTDLPLVKNRGLVFGSVWFILALICGGVVWTVRENSAFEDEFFKTQSQLENLPYRPKRFNQMYQKIRKPDKFMGSIVSKTPISETQSKIVVRNQFEQFEFILDESVNSDNFKINQDVIIRFDQSNSNQILDIKLAGPEQSRRFRQPIQP